MKHFSWTSCNSYYMKPTQLVCPRTSNLFVHNCYFFLFCTSGNICNNTWHKSGLFPIYISQSSGCEAIRTKFSLLQDQVGIKWNYCHWVDFHKLLLFRIVIVTNNPRFIRKWKKENIKVSEWVGSNCLKCQIGSVD